MPYEVKFGDNLPAGYSMTAIRGGGTVQVSVREFVSSEDGDLFISRLEGIPQSLISMLPQSAGITPSVVDHLLAIIRRDRTGTIYVNELKTSLLMRTRREDKAGDFIYLKDVIDIDRMRFEGVDIPDDAGIAVLFSVGWRKGLYYDLNPTGHNPVPRNYDLEVALGQYYAYLLFQDLFKISEQDWKEFIKQKWFPFIYLGQPLLKRMIEHVRAGWQLDDLLDEIATETKCLLEESRAVWRDNPYISDHVELIERAADRYLNNDFISTASILFPRIEGIMRAYRRVVGIKHRPTGSNLAKAVVEKDANDRHAATYLLPESFRHYLENVYFAEFKDGQEAQMSRHSMAHGEVKPDQFSRKSATIGFLLLYQLALFLKPEKKWVNRK
ncbi:MAG: hypothetical protein AABY87_01275 [bacterium]